MGTTIAQLLACIWAAVALGAVAMTIKTLQPWWSFTNFPSQLLSLAIIYFIWLGIGWATIAAGMFIFTKRFK